MHFPVTEQLLVETPKIATLTTVENTRPRKLETTGATKVELDRPRNSIRKRSNSTFQVPNRPSLPPPIR